MDYSLWIPTAILQVLFCGFAAGHNLSGPDNVTVVIKNGQATVFWDPPEWAPSLAHYQVELKRYSRSGGWSAVPACNSTHLTCCDISDIIRPLDYYFVRVRLVTEHTASQWTKGRRKLCLAESELLPPAFILLANSSSLRVKVHVNPTLKKIFLSGLLYKIYLKEVGQKNQTASVVLLVNSYDKDEKEGLFNYLQWGHEYCVSGTVEAIARPTISEVSTEHCIILPRPEWYKILIMGLVALALMAVLGLLVLLVWCMAKPPEKLPITLRSSVSGWRPLSVTETQVESVTDKGWLLMSGQVQGKSGGMEEKSTVTMEERDGEDRRDSTDSGVSMSQTDGERGQGEAGWQQEDSGCGSLGSSSGGFEEPPLLDGRNNSYGSTQIEDSGAGLEHHKDSGVECEECGMMTSAVVVVGDGYRHQAPTSVEVLSYERKVEGEGTPTSKLQESKCKKAHHSFSTLRSHAPLNLLA
ncbi:hypothetical protein MATL_G00043870 [Megalops atlanticus]|uniref:Fibronectin type-III domain-containing protein n=1 Tax=Megalops atlanticus TaxID=7932 RepID=A0A9D3QBJ0_MEGAT|nr:hypothetical protein MATL_G00043870 [Megalops atlanticus]